jgi:hypothetical protein
MLTKLPNWGELAGFRGGSWRPLPGQVWPDLGRSPAGWPSEPRRRDSSCARSGFAEGEPAAQKAAASELAAIQLQHAAASANAEVEAEATRADAYQRGREGADPTVLLAAGKWEAIARAEARTVHLEVITKLKETIRGWERGDLEMEIAADRWFRAVDRRLDLALRQVTLWQPVG